MARFTVGKHRATALSAVLSETKGGAPQIAVQCVGIDDPSMSDTWYGFFTEATQERTIESLRVIGWTGNDFSVFEQGKELPAEMLGTEFVVVVENDTYEGVTRAKIQWINRADGGIAVKSPMSTAAVASFAARMKAACIAYDKANGNGVKAAPRPAAPQKLDDMPEPF